MSSLPVPYSIPFAVNFLQLLIFLLLPYQSISINRNIGIVFSSLPESRVAPPGDRVFFDCKTNIGKGEQIRWLHNGNRLDKQTKYVKIGDGELTIRVRKSKRHLEGQTGRYQCVAGLEGRLLMSPPATLTVAHLDKFPDRSDLPTRIEANIGNNVLISCGVPESNPPAIVQWEKDGAMMNMSTDHSTLVSSGLLLLQNLQSEHGGEYACRASNHLTRESHLSHHPISLTVLPEGELHKPRLLAEPEKEYHAVQGEDITLPCSASGSPKPTVMWEHEVFNQQPVPLYQQGPSELLQLTNLTANSSGTYSCKIWSSRGRRILRKTVVYVAEKPEANIRSFSDGPFKEGGPLELYCQAEGFPAPQVYWVFNGVRQHLGFSDLSDPSSAKLLIHSLRLENAGVYQCFAENRAGVASDAVLVSVVPGVRERGEEEEVEVDEDEREHHHGKKRGWRRRGKEKVKPSPPSVIQKSRDSVSISWTMETNTTHKVAFFKVQYRDLGLKTRDSSCPRKEEAHQPPHTIDGEIAPTLRSYEISGLFKDHCYRFKVSAVFEDHDSSQSKFSPRFKMETRLQSPPRVIPLVSKILNISDTSLSINWVLPENATAKDDITGYFILFRESSTAGDYSHLTIFGEGTHSHILDNLKPGTSYDIKVQAFNMNGGGHYSKVQYGRTNGPAKRGGRQKAKLKSARPSSSRGKDFSNENEEDLGDDDAAMYLTIGVSLGLICVIGLGACSVLTCVQRRRRSSKFSDSNAAIHSKYQDTSLQITGQQQENRGMDEAVDWRVGDAKVGTGDTSTESGVHETSFSVSPTDHSYDGLDNSSQGSTALAQDHSRGNLNYTTSPAHHLDYSLESLAEEYTDEPSIGWKRRRRSEEIL